MKVKKKTAWWLGIVVVILVAGFIVYRVLGNRNTTQTTLRTAVVQRGSVKASLNSSGTARAGQSVTMAWQTSGRVALVTVQLGDQVDANKELAALDTTSLSISMIDAKQNLVTAKQTLDDLLNSKLKQAQAQQAVEEAQKALDSLNATAATNSSQAQLALAEAQSALDDAQRARTALNYPHSTDPLVIENAQTKYLQAKLEYKEALKEYSKVAHKRLVDPVRARALERVLTAKQKMDTALATYNWYILKPTSKEIAQADADLAVAKANLAKAQANWDTQKNGASAATVAMAEATLSDAQREWERQKDGPTPEDIASAQADVDAAQATINQYHLVAPITGTITKVDTHSGDQVSSGTSAFRIDDLTSVYIDLQISEVDIQSIKLGQPATLTFDALGNKQYAGEVTTISVIGSVSQGVVNYPVTVRITNPDASLRPSLTAAASIIIDQHDNVLMVPNRAIRTSSGQRTVTVLFEGQQIVVPVTVGLTNGSMSEVVSDQLQEGDEVVLTGTTASSSSSSNRNGNDFPGGGSMGGPPPGP